MFRHNRPFSLSFYSKILKFKSQKKDLFILFLLLKAMSAIAAELRGEMEGGESRDMNHVEGGRNIS